MLRARQWSLGFALFGAVGPLMTFALPLVDVKSEAYYVLYLTIAVITPAWLLGTYEYSWGNVAAGTIVLLSNVAAWATLGAMLGQKVEGLKGAFITFAALSIVAAYEHLVVGTIVATITLPLLLSVIPIFERSRGQNVA